MSNTSNFPIGEVGRHLKHRGRVLGLHFFMPAHLVPLVEVVSSDATDPRIAQSMVDLMKELGKAPIWVKKDVPGFVGNRIQHAMMREALYLIRRRHLRRGGHRHCGALWVRLPLHRLRADHAEGDVGLGHELPGRDRALPAPLQRTTPRPKMLKEMVEKNHLGMKTKRGFWEWTDEAIAKEKAGIERRCRPGWRSSRTTSEGV